MADVFQVAEADAAQVVKDIEQIGAEIYNFIRGAIAAAKTGGIVTYLEGVGAFINIIEKTAAADVGALEGTIAGAINDLKTDAANFNAGKPVGFEVTLPVVGIVSVVVKKGPLA